jgi:hypothetical protein
LDLSLSAPSLSAPVTVPTENAADDSLMKGTASQDSPTNPVTSSSQSADVQLQLLSTSGAVQASDGLTGDVAAGFVSTLEPISLPPATVRVTPIGSGTPSNNGPRKTPVAVGISVELSRPVAIVAELVDAGTLVAIETLSIRVSRGGQDKTAGGSDGPSNPSLDDGSGAPVGGSEDGGSQAASAATAQIQGTVDSDNNSDQSSAVSLPSVAPAAVSLTGSVPANAGSGIGLTGNQQPSVLPGGSTSAVLATNGSAVTGVPANSESSSLRSAAPDVRPTPGGSLTSGQVPSRSRGENEINAPPPLSTVPGFITTETQAIASATDPDHLSSVSDSPSVAEHASYRSDLRSLIIAMTRPTPPLDLFSMDLVFAERVQLEQRKPKVRDVEQAQAEEPVMVLCAGDSEESPGSAVARGAGLLGSPLPFDVDALAREAQQFYEQIDYLSQNLASLLAHMKLPPWGVALAVAAAVAAVARRRSEKNQRGLVLESCTSTAFACYPGLGGSWTWEES